MKGAGVVFSAERNDWQTPESLLHTVRQEFPVALDCAANAHNTVCREWLGPGSPLCENALQLEHYVKAYVELKRRNLWGWLNPPYEANALFMAWAFHHVFVAGTFAGLVLLVPARTDTRWFHDFLYQREPHVELRFLKGRLKFTLPPDPNLRFAMPKATESAPFPSMLVIMRRDP